MTDVPEPVLPLSLFASNRDQFNALFYEPVSVALQTKTNLHVHVLRVEPELAADVKAELENILRKAPPPAVESVPPS